MDKVASQDEVPTGSANMGNDPSRDFRFRHELGETDADKPGQFHRVLVDNPDYSAVIEPPVLTKISVGDQLQTLPPESSTDSKSGTELNGVDDTVKDEKAVNSKTDDTDASKNLEALDENQIKLIAKELVNQVVNNALAKVNNETDAGGAVVVNGVVSVVTETARPEDIKENSDTPAVAAIELSVNGETGIEEARVVEAVTVNGDTVKQGVEANITTDIDNNAQPDTGQSQVNSSVGDEPQPVVVKGKDKSRNKVKKSKSKKAEKNLREREVIESVKKDLKESKLEEKKSEKGKGFLKMFKFSKRKPNVVADISSKSSDGDENKTSDHTDCIINGGQVELNDNHVEINEVEQIVQSNQGNGSKHSDDTVEVGNINISKDTRSIDSGVVVDKVIEAKVDIDNAMLENKTDDPEKVTPVVTTFNSEEGQTEDVATTVIAQVSAAVDESVISNDTEETDKPTPCINAAIEIVNNDSGKPIQEGTNTENEDRSGNGETNLGTLQDVGVVTLNGDLPNTASVDVNVQQESGLAEKVDTDLLDTVSTEANIKQESAVVEDVKEDVSNTVSAEVNLKDESTNVEELSKDLINTLSTKVNLNQESTGLEEINKDLIDNVPTEINLSQEPVDVEELDKGLPNTNVSTEIDLKPESAQVEEIKSVVESNVSTELNIAPELNAGIVSLTDGVANDGSTEVNLTPDPAEKTVDIKADVPISAPAEVNLPSDPVSTEVELKGDLPNNAPIEERLKCEQDDVMAVKTELTNIGSTEVNIPDSSKTDIKINSVAPEIKSDPPSDTGHNLTDRLSDFSERGVDVEGLDASIEKVVIEKDIPDTISKLTDGLENTSDHTALKNDVAIKDNTNTEDIPDTNVKPTVKIKKRSWSFQIGGSKKKVEGLDKHNEEPKPKTQPNPDVRKPRWKLGKLSFRKSQADVSVSTPNLNEAGMIPEEGDSGMKQGTKDSKSKSILKKIKAKKEKKRESQRREADSFERRSNSLMDIAIGDNRAGSRRSIVEEDVPYVQTDAFEGVDLSDLSADEDATVSKNPSGSGPVKKSDSKGNGLAARAKDFFKMDKKKSSPTTIQPDSQEDKVAISGITMVGDGEYAQITHQDVTDDMKIDVVNVEVTHMEAPIVSVEEEEVKVELVERTEAVVSESAGDVYAQIMKRETKPDVKCETAEDNGNKKESPLNMEQRDSKNRDTELNESVDQTGESKEAAKRDDGEIADANASGVTGFSNPICGDGSFSFDVLQSLDGALKGENEDTESDSYVQLDKMVSEFRPGNLSPKPTDTKPTTNTITVLKQGDDNLNGETGAEIASPVSEDNPVEDVAETIAPVQWGNVYAEPKAPVKAGKSRVIIMKEVGVQAPDIHMPLDIERDFGFFTEESPRASVGVQVATGSMPLETDGGGGSGGSMKRQTSKCSINISPAYF